MAIYVLKYDFLDQDGRETSRQLLADAADETALLAAASTMHTSLLTLSKCAVPTYSYTQVVAPGGSPGSGSNIDAGATFRFNTTLPINPTFNLPDPEEAIKAGSGVIDLTNVDVAAWIALFTSGPWRLNRNVPTQPSGVLSAKLDK